MQQKVWQLLQEYRELERLIRENPDVARLFDGQDINRPVPWWQENHQGLAKANRKRRKLGTLPQSLTEARAEGSNALVSL